MLVVVVFSWLHQCPLDPDIFMRSIESLVLVVNVFHAT